MVEGWPDGADGQPQAAGVDILYENVLRALRVDAGAICGRMQAPLKTLGSAEATGAGRATDTASSTGWHAPIG